MPIRKKIYIYIVLTLLIAALILFLYIYRAKIGKIFSPFLMAVIVAYLINPIVAKLEIRNIRRRTAVLLIYAVFAMVLSVTMIFIVPEFVNNAKELANTLPQIVSDYQDMFLKFTSSIQSSNWSADVKNIIFSEIQGGAAAIQAYISGSLKKAMEMLIDTATMFFDLLLSFVIAYYFIKDADFFKKSGLSLIPRKWRNGILAAGREINEVISNFIKGQLLTAFIVGVMEIAGLLVVRVKYPLILGLVGGLANIIPYFGPIIGAVPAIAVALIESPIKAAWTAVVFIVVQQIDNNFISPKIIEGRVGLHPVTTIISVLAAGQFFGIPGMLFAVPLVAILKIILRRIVKAIV